MGDAPNLWDINYFEPPTPHVPAPSPRVNVPKPIPDIQDLFRVQRNTLKVLNDLDVLEAHLGDHKDHKLHVALRRLRGNAEDAYRVVNTFLKHHTQEAL